MQSRNAQRSSRRLIGARRSPVTHTRSLLRVVLVAIAAAASALLGLAAPSAAQGVIATGSGRAGATVAALVALIGVVTGGLALARSSGRVATGNGRAGAIVALVLGLVGMVLGRLALARSSRVG